MNATLVPLTDQDITAISTACEEFHGMTKHVLSNIISKYQELKESEILSQCSPELPQNYLSIASLELQVPIDEIPFKLKLRLHRLNRLVTRAGGELASRQVIALALLDYLSEYKS